MLLFLNFDSLVFTLSYRKLRKLHIRRESQPSTICKNSDPNNLLGSIFFLENKGGFEKNISLAWLLGNSEYLH